jgi:hypothetical protein
MEFDGMYRDAIEREIEANKSRFLQILRANIVLSGGVELTNHVAWLKS